MRWIPIPEILPKRVFRYLLHRYFGQYVQNLSQDQLSYNWDENIGKVDNVYLAVESLNEQSEKYNFPFEFRDVHIDSVSITVPWKSLMTENSLIEVNGVTIVVQLKQRCENVSMFDSMWGSMSSSLQLAEGCLQSDVEIEPQIDVSQVTNGLEICAKTIDTIFAKVKAKVTNVTIKVQSMLENNTTGVSLEFHIDSVDYYDEAGADDLVQKSNSLEKNTYEPLAYSTKKFVIEGMSVYTRLFQCHGMSHVNKKSEILTPGSPEMPPTHSEMSNRNFDYQDDLEMNSEPALISRITGKQEIRLKIKQSESIVGPKLDLEVNLGALNFFLSPYQVHLVLELARGLTATNTSKNSNKPHGGTRSRPMIAADFALVEQELQRRQVKPEVQPQSLNHHRGWSSQSLDDSDEEFHLMPNESPSFTPQPPDLDSSCSSIGSESRLPFQGSSCSSSSGGQKPRSRASSMTALLQDPLSDSGKLRATCSSICVIVLHEDVSQSRNNHEPSAKVSSEANMSSKISAEKFFDDLVALLMSGIDFKNFQDVRKPLSALCQSNHLRIMASGITLEGNEKSSSSQRAFNVSLTSADLEILECLFTQSPKNTSKLEHHYTELLISKRNEQRRNENKVIEWNEPCIKIKYHVECTNRTRILKYPANKLNVHMGPFKAEVDLSVIDRVHCLLSPHPMFSKKEKAEEYVFSWKDDVCSKFSQKTEITVKSPFIVINFRFPKPDLRPLHDMGRPPWWQQNLHKEVLCMELSDASFSTTLDDESSEKKMEIQCRDFHGLFSESNASKPISFLHVSVDPESEQSVQDSGFDWPRLVIHIVPHSAPSVFDADPPDSEDFFPSSHSWADMLLQNFTKEPSPFSNAVFYGSELLLSAGASDDDRKNGFCENTEMVMPADKEKVQEFIDKTISKSRYFLEFFLPAASIFLPDKHFYELLYNRLGSDLVLWQPTSLPPTHNLDSKSYRVHVPMLDVCQTLSCESFQTFQSCMTDIATDSDEDDDVGAYSSFHEYAHKQKLKQKKSQANDSLITKLCISLYVKKGVGVIQSPVRDSSQNVLPGRCGKVMLEVEDCTFFAASSYKGDPNESYMCLSANKGTMYHCGSTVCSGEFPDVQSVSRSAEGLRRIIYRSEKGIPLKAGIAIGTGGESLNMLSLSLHVVHDIKQQIKTFKVAVGMKGTTLRHYMCSSTETWLAQLLDFLNVADYPIHGYTSPANITEFHLHLDHCAVDYRPLHLPLRTVLTAENFNLSSNITASTSTSLLRIISENLCLFLSNNVTAPAIDLKKNYVCIIQTGLIDMLLRIVSDKVDVKPKTEMCATNDIIHIRTCVDSCKALQSLITYLASDGDFGPHPSCLKDKCQDGGGVLTILKYYRRGNNATKRLLPLAMRYVPKGSGEPVRCEVSQAVVPRKDVHTLIEEAMKECPTIVSDSSPHSENECDGFMKFTDINLNIADEEFCILEDDPGVGLLPKGGEPEIRLLTSEPVQPTRNHFVVPSSKSDLLKAPKHFPSPLVCYCLTEMSVIWHIYGGNDFKDQKSSKKKKVKISNAYLQDGGSDGQAGSQNCVVNIDSNLVSFCKVTADRNSLDLQGVRLMIEDCTIEAPRFDYYDTLWRERGGENRDTKVLMEFHLKKVRFQHEVYPEDSEYASRDVLLIYDIEIRDRLASSDINKFLYQYSSEAMPRQSNAHMLEMKALYTRPDPTQNTEECSLHVSCKPLRLNIDQDALIFLCAFFGEICEMNTDKVSPVQRESSPLGATDYTSPTEPLITIAPNSTAGRPADQPSPTFFRSFSFAPDVLIRLDYQGKRLIMEQGALQGVLMGLAQLNCSKLRLKRLSYRHGLLGRDKLVQYALNEWSQDIKKNQLPDLLGGVGPMHSFVQLFQGIKNLVWMPIEQYRKDGQIVRGIQRGAASFSTSTAMAVLELTSRLVNTIQSAAVVAYDMVSPGPSVSSRLQTHTNLWQRSSQPADIREGVVKAYDVVKEGLGDTARSIVRVASVEHDHKGVRGAVGGVLRQIPPAIMKPILIGAEATGIFLGGVKNQLSPDAHKEAVDKWRTSSK